MPKAEDGLILLFGTVLLVYNSIPFAASLPQDEQLLSYSYNAFLLTMLQPEASRTQLPLQIIIYYRFPLSSNIIHLWSSGGTFRIHCAWDFI